jgi:hypothetical protein
LGRYLRAALWALTRRVAGQVVSTARAKAGASAPVSAFFPLVAQHHQHDSDQREAKQPDEAESRHGTRPEGFIVDGEYCERDASKVIRRYGSADDVGMRTLPWRLWVQDDLTRVLLLMIPCPVLFMAGIWIGECVPDTGALGVSPDSLAISIFGIFATAAAACPALIALDLMRWLLGVRVGRSRETPHRLP